MFNVGIHVFNKLHTFQICEQKNKQLKTMIFGFEKLATIIVVLVKNRQLFIMDLAKVLAYIKKLYTKDFDTSLIT